MDIKKGKKVVVIGAGPAGLAAAYYAQKNGYQVTLIEKSDIPGGKGGSRKYKNFIVDFGPHAYHAMTKEITDFVLEHSGGQMIDIPVLQKLYITEKPMGYPLNFKEAISKFSLWLNARIALDYVYVKFKSLFLKLPQNSFKQYGIANFGRTLYDICFGLYSERVWGCSADELSAEFAKRKLPNLSLGGIFLELLTQRKKKRKNDKSYLNIKRYLYHKWGIGNVYQNIAADITAKGGKVFYNSEIQGIYFKEGEKIAAITLKQPQDFSIECDYLISTAPLVDLVGYFSPGVELLNRLKEGLPFRHGLIVNAILNREKLSDAHWIYLVNKRFHFNRLSEPKNFSAHLAPKNKTLIMLEKICDESDPQWHWSPHTWRDVVQRELVFFGVKADEIEDIFLTSMDKAFPFYLVGYEKIKKEFLAELSKIENLISTGRYGLYLDIDMHDAMILGKEAFNYLVSQRVQEFYDNHETIYLNKRE